MAAKPNILVIWLPISRRRSTRTGSSPRRSLSIKESAATRTDAHRFVSREPRPNFVSELCHIPPETLGNTVIYGDTPMHIDVAEVVDRNCVGGFWCASARAGGIDFQACSIDHSDISPFRINDLRAARNSVAQNPPSNLPNPRSLTESTICERRERRVVANCVRPLNVARSPTAILLRRSGRAQGGAAARIGAGV